MKPRIRIRKWHPVKDELTTIRFFGDQYPDGFPDDGSETVAWCPRCQEKRSVSTHEECTYFRGELVEGEGEVSAIICAFPKDHFTHEASQEENETSPS